jgi:beta-ureidopropionase / N-carbamoyl-L-amino-acid hydrolase
MTKTLSNLQIDSARLWGTIHETAKFGATAKGGVKRLTLSQEDKQVRDWFRKACEDAGLEVHVDALGSMFGLRRGKDMSKLPVGLGSHLDTQPTGGKYDGVLGTLAALEMVRTLNDAGIETDAPLCICNWTNEEGSRFAPAMMASAAYVGDFTTEDILSRRDSEGVTVAQALDGIGYRGGAPVGTQKLSCFVELHIEQGPILEAEGKTIGVVDSGQGVLWYDGRIVGFESHAGSTPMPLRRDALATLSEIVLAMEAIAGKHGPNAVGTIGEAVIPERSHSQSIVAARMLQSWTRWIATCAPRSPRSQPAARSRLRSISSGARSPPISIRNWSTRWKRRQRCWDIPIAASRPAPVTTPAISTQKFRRRWCSYPARTASATTNLRMRPKPIALPARTC